MNPNIPKVYWWQDYDKNEVWFRVQIKWFENEKDEDFEMLCYTGLFEDLMDAVNHVFRVRQALEDLAEQYPNWKTPLLLHHTLNFDYWNWSKSNRSNRMAVRKVPEYVILSTSKKEKE